MERVASNADALGPTEVGHGGAAHDVVGRGMGRHRPRLENGRGPRIVYQMLGDTLAAREVLEWEITMWYAPDAGGFVKAVDRSFGIVNFELAPSADLVALRMRAGVPGLGRPAATSPDSARPHRDAARDTCGLLRCAPAASQPLAD